MTQRHQRIAGFTMLEMSVVLGIIALIAGAGINMAAGAIKAADRVTTQERLNTIKLALDSFGKTYGYLPCPADRNKTPRTAGFGIAVTSTPAHPCNDDPSDATKYEVKSGIAIGALPVRTLGLPDSYAGDAWGNKMSYAVTAVLTTDPTSYVKSDGAINVKYGVTTANVNFAQSTNRFKPSISVYDCNSGVIRLTVSALKNYGSNNLANGQIVQFNGTSDGTTNVSGSYVVQNLSAGPKRFELANSTGCTAPTGTVEWQESGGTGASYIVISHGPDGRGAYPLSATAIPSNKVCNNSPTANSSPAPCTSNASTKCNDIENCQTGGALDATFFDTTYNDGATDTYYFDDYVVWGSNASYRAPIYNTLYTGTTNNCPANTCEPWCAACAVNYPGPGTTGTGSGPSFTVPPTDALANAAPYISLCKKVVFSDRTSCKASCFWSGLDNQATPNYYRCP